MIIGANLPVVPNYEHPESLVGPGLVHNVIVLFSISGSQEDSF